ncbi:hypothetical protein [Pseudoroseicyclus sp. CXY001]|uniref:hypothetical protein n=1 Tax=Pseudoroseicyclus sp. CXY001 TaxID=3242492 RepID=UPI003570D965
MESGPQQTFAFQERLAERLAAREAAQEAAQAAPKLGRGNGGGRAILLLGLVAAALALFYLYGGALLPAPSAPDLTVEAPAAELPPAPAPAEPEAAATDLQTALHVWVERHLGPLAEALEPEQLLIVAGTALLFVVIFALLMLKLVMRLIFGRSHRSVRDMGYN